MKTFRIITAILLVFAIGSGAAFFITSRNKAPVVDEDITQTAVFSLASSGYSSAVSVAGTGTEFFMPTDVSGIYYSANLKNEVEFYQFDGTNFASLPTEKKTLDISLNCTYESIPVRLTYTTIANTIIGYGLFTSDMNESVKKYPYAFVKIAKAPAGYGDGYLLLADFNKDDFFNPDKTYSEIYTFDEKKTSYSTAVSQNTRLVNSQGVFRQDWTMMTDEFMRDIGKNKYFMSSRYYSEEETGLRTDIMVYSNAYRPQIVVKDILGTWFVCDGENKTYLRKTDEGFASVTAGKDGKEKEICTFEGDYSERYLRSGNFLADKETAMVTNLLTGETFPTATNIAKANLFSISPDGSKVAFSCPAEENEAGTPIQTVIYSSVDGSASPVVFHEPMLRCEGTGFTWIDSSRVMSIRPMRDDGYAAGCVIYTFGSVQGQ